MKYAWVENEKIRDVCQGGDPAHCYHSDVAAHYTTQVPDDAVPGATLVSGAWGNPVLASSPAPTVLQPLAPMAFYSAFTPLERIAIKASADAIVQEFWDTYQRAERTGTLINPNDASVLEGLSYLAGTPIAGHTIAQPILASTARIAQIQAGLAQ